MHKRGGNRSSQTGDGRVAEEETGASDRARTGNALMDFCFDCLIVCEFLSRACGLLYTRVQVWINVF